MSCFLPFNNRNLDICFFVFRPTVVIVDELLDTLRQFSGYTRSLGCVQNAIFKSIHGNMVIWYGAWMKKSCEDKEHLNAALLSMLKNVSSMAVLTEHSFLDAYGGQSKDGSSAAKFKTGDTIGMVLMKPQAGDMEELTYANLALFKSRFQIVQGISSGVCLSCPSLPRVASFYVWKSLNLCYSWILNYDYRKAMLPYLERYSLEVKSDIFRVVHVCNDRSVPSYYHLSFPTRMLENEIETKEKRQGVVQD